VHRTFLSLVAVAALLVAQPQAQNAQSKASARPAATPSAAVVNLNTATVSDLQRLPGIGAKTAARILEYREKKGPFKKIEELMNVQGIGEKNFLKLRTQVTVATKPERSNPEQD